MGSKEKWFPQVLLPPGADDEFGCQHQYLQHEHQYALFQWVSLSVLGPALLFAFTRLCFQWHHCKMPSHLYLLPSLIISFLSEINKKMLYYGEQQELSPEEISEKLVLAQKMLEEIRSRQPFFTQRELVDEEADEAHERRCIQLLEPSTCLLSLWVQERDTESLDVWWRQPIPNIERYLELTCGLRESFSTTWLYDQDFQIQAHP